MSIANPNRGITRIDLPGSSTHGFQVRIQRRGKRYAKFFADGIFGDPAKALRAARAWRDALVKKLEEDDQARICQRSSRNSSGVVGVSRVKVRTNGTEYEFWQATWSPAPGQRRCVKFSIKRHGDREAFRLAVETRRDAVG